MKNYLLLLFLMLTLVSYSQNAVGIAVLQDAKLVVSEDDAGNKPFTADVTLKTKWQGQERSLGYLVLGAKYRYSDLIFEDVNDATGNLQRYGVEAQYAFHLGTNSWHFSPLIGYGLQTRSNRKAASSWEIGGEITYSITPWLKGVAEGVYMGRPHIAQTFVFNGSLGIQIDIDTDYQKKQAKKGTRF